jgi:peptide/nickel transport system permease protein
MQRYLFRRAMALVPTLLGVILLAMLIPRLVPGDVVTLMIGSESIVSPERAQEMRRLLGIGKPLHVEYWDYLRSVLTGDLGASLRTGVPVLPTLLPRLDLSMRLAIFALILGVLVSLPTGILSAALRNSRLDIVVRLGSLLGLSIPNFWLGTLFLLVATVYIPGVFPTVASVTADTSLAEFMRAAFLPALTLALTMTAVLTRLTRSSMLEVLRQDYVAVARAKGLAEGVVLYKHALRNAVIPVTTEIGLQFGLLLGGVILVETVFTYPGLGTLIVRAIEQRDYTILQGALLVIALIFTLTNLLVDIGYGLLDPRIRYE